MKYQEIMTKSVSELYDVLYNLKKELLSFRIQRVTGSSFKTSQQKKNRRDIARIKTRLNSLRHNNQARIN